MSAFTLVVQIQVKPECVEAFCEATLANVRASRQEPGILRFDLLKQQDATDRFLLIEEFREPVMSVTDHTTRTLDKIPAAD